MVIETPQVEKEDDPLQRDVDHKLLVSSKGRGQPARWHISDTEGSEGQGKCAYFCPCWFAWGERAESVPANTLCAVS